MAWIHQDTIDAIRNNVRISDVFMWLGERVSSNNRQAWCPFCHDKDSVHPGCSIDNENGLWHCFICNRGGSLFSFVEEHEGCSFPEAVEMLARQFKIEVKYDETHGDARRDSRRRHLASIMERINEIFIAQRGQPEFAEFVRSRGLTQEAVERFELGFSAGRFANAAISRLRERFSDDDIVAAGIAYRRDDGSLGLQLRDRVTVPIRSISGQLVAFGGRDVTGRSPAKYKNSPETELFKKGSVLYGMNVARREISRKKAAILCEGYMDTIALHQHGFPNAIGAMGTAVTMRNLTLLSRTADVLYVSLDADKAGVQAAGRIARNIPEGLRMDVRAIEMPLDVAKDPDEWFNQAGRTPEEYETLLRSATPIFLFCARHTIDDEVDRIDAAIAAGDDGALHDARRQADHKVSELMAGAWGKMDADQRRSIAESFVMRTRTSTTPDDLLMRWRSEAASNPAGRGRRGQAKQEPEDRLRPVFSSSESRSEDLLIGALYYASDDARGVAKRRHDDVSEAFTSPVRQAVFEKLSQTIAEGKPPKSVQDRLSEPELAEFSRIVASPAIRDHKDQMGSETIEGVCDDIERAHLMKLMDEASNSPDLDFSVIFDLQDRLNEIDEKIASRKAK